MLSVTSRIICILCACFLCGCGETSQQNNGLPYTVEDVAAQIEQSRMVETRPGPGPARPGFEPAAADVVTEFTETPSGLKYRILRESDKPKPGPQDRVEVYYKGWLDDGSEFDGNYRASKPIGFSLDQVIAAWQEGVPLVGVGGMIELDVPPALGYGKAGSGKIPPNARLHFIVELVGVGPGGRR